MYVYFFNIAGGTRVLMHVQVIPVWSAEVSSHEARGAFLAIEFFMVSLLQGIKLTKDPWLISYSRTLEGWHLHTG